MQLIKKKYQHTHWVYWHLNTLLKSKTINELVGKVLQPYYIVMSYKDWSCSSCLPSAISSMTLSQKAGKSAGFLEVTKPWSVTTS